MDPLQPPAMTAKHTEMGSDSAKRIITSCVGQWFESTGVRQSTTSARTSPLLASGGVVLDADIRQCLAAAARNPLPDRESRGACDRAGRVGSRCGRMASSSARRSHARDAIVASANTARLAPRGRLRVRRGGRLRGAKSTCAEASLFSVEWRGSVCPTVPALFFGKPRSQVHQGAATASGWLSCNVAYEAKDSAPIGVTTRFMVRVVVEHCPVE